MRTAGLAVSVSAAAMALALAGSPAHAAGQTAPPSGGGLININAPLIYNTGDIDLIEDVFEHISIPILGQAVHQMYDWARFDGVLKR
ncbi:hypothetical protein [Streptomyces sp. CAU 1734]|uniref:hypothetical protein n=1 Tax=Streptomyces sp. CAU 1734 TaxID=3140360 RepID=UPI0032617671